MAGRISIAVDAMSGDWGPGEVVEAAVKALEAAPDLSIILVGNQEQLRSCVSHLATSPRLVIHHAPDVVSMDEKPTHALRRKRNSSMAVALQLVCDGLADGCVSGGNTGALMLLSRSILRTYPGIERPAIVKRIPSLRGSCYVLDLGANVDCTAENLYQFAIMGAVLVQAVDGVVAPRIALLNVGEEEIKGNEQVRLASQMLREHGQINYIGYVEGGDIFSNAADVIVCDGFVGNVALKTGEGLAELLLGFMHKAFARHWYTRLLGWLCRPVLRPVFQRLDPAGLNGASVLGLRGVVVKSHGAARAHSIVSAILLAADEARNKVPQRIGERVESLIF